MLSSIEERPKSQRRTSQLVVELRINAAPLIEAIRKFGVSVAQASHSFNQLSEAFSAFEDINKKLERKREMPDDLGAIEKEVQHRLLTGTFSGSFNDQEISAATDIVTEWVQGCQLLASFIRVDFNTVDGLISGFSSAAKVGRMGVLRSMVKAARESGHLINKIEPPVPGFLFVNDKFWKADFFPAGTGEGVIEVKACKYIDTKVRRIRVGSCDDEAIVKFECCEHVSGKLVSLALWGEGPDIFLIDDILYRK